jgi:hypothetical protein
MIHNNFHFCRLRLVMAALFALAIQPAFAKDALLVSGSYHVVQNKELGSRSQIQLRIHLVNHGPSDLSIQRMTLWDFSHPDKGGTRDCAVMLGAHASAETTQDFTIRRSDFELWQRGLHPRLVLETTSPGNSRSKTVVRLDRMSGQEAK